MLDNLESNYDCARSGEDLHDLKQELASLREQQVESKESQERINRLENQISFILNKCDITH
jgi:polyhydroxyalkanoate synthesis regulator phasin